MKSPVDHDAVSSSTSLWPSPEMTKCTVSWWCRCKSELSPGGIICRKISKVVVGSVPAMDDTVGLCTWPDGVGDRSEELGHAELRSGLGHQTASVRPPSTVSTVPLT